MQDLNVTETEKQLTITRLSMQFVCATKWTLFYNVQKGCGRCYVCEKNYMNPSKQAS